MSLRAIKFVAAVFVGLSSTMSFAQSAFQILNPPEAYRDLSNGEIRVVSTKDADYLHTTASSFSNKYRINTLDLPKWTKLTVDPTQLFIVKNRSAGRGEPVSVQINAALALKNPVGTKATLGYLNQGINTVELNSVATELQVIDAAKIERLVKRVPSGSYISIGSASLIEIARVTNKSTLSRIISAVVAHDPVSANSMAASLDALATQPDEVPQFKVMETAFKRTEARLKSVAEKAANAGREVDTHLAVEKAAVE